MTEKTDASRTHLVKLLEKLIKEKDQYKTFKREGDVFTLTTVSGRRFSATPTGIVRRRDRNGTK